ncbi:hypothetical protein VTH06DRAFT_1012 [Thermothelomyces fergusii]
MSCKCISSQFCVPPKPSSVFFSNECQPALPIIPVTDRKQSSRRGIEAKVKSNHDVHVLEREKKEGWLEGQLHRKPRRCFPTWGANAGNPEAAAKRLNTPPNQERVLNGPNQDESKCLEEREVGRGPRKKKDKE